MFKVNDKNIRATSLTLFCLAFFIFNFEHISHPFLVSLLLTLSKQMLPGKDIRMFQ